jgi:hypothetical protein
LLVFIWWHPPKALRGKKWVTHMKKLSTTNFYIALINKMTFT